MFLKVYFSHFPDIPATLDSNLFSSFFGGAPVLNVPGRTFPVATYHLEDLLDGCNHIIEEGSRYALRETYGRGGTAAIQISTRGGEKRQEVHSLESGGVHLADVSDDYPGYTLATRRYRCLLWMNAWRVEVPARNSPSVLVGC